MMHIAILDDDAALLRSAEIILSCAGHRVAAFGRAEEAEAYLRGGAAPDLLILDYALTGTTGDVFLGRVRPLLPRDCKVVLISAHTDLIEPLDLIALGVDAFLPKPLDFNGLSQFLRYAEAS